MEMGKRAWLKRPGTIIYSGTLALLFLKTFYWKFLWNVPEVFFLGISIAAGMLYYICHPMYFNNRRKILSLLIAFFYLIHLMSNLGEGAGGIFLTIVNVLLVLVIDNEDKKTLFKAIKFVFTLICFVSLVGWISVNILHIALPMHYSQYGIYQFYDYGIFNMRVEGIAFSRYLGMFLEPGYTGVMCVLLVCCDRFNLKHIDNVILLICALFTLSLAAYLLIALYWLFYKLLCLP